jgi:hypothetical protein
VKADFFSFNFIFTQFFGTSVNLLLTSDILHVNADPEIMTIEKTILKELNQNKILMEVLI